MKTPLLFLVMALWLIPLPQTSACTAFFLRQGRGMILAKNLDWPVDLGYVIYNPAGLRKQAFVTDTLVSPFQWTAQYPSLTFNQFGMEFPLGGMNSQGLVVEELNMPQVKIDQDSTRLQFNEFQFVQFLLDNCAHVEDIRKQLNRLHYAPLFLHLHYLVADEKGETAILEFDGSQWQIFAPQKPVYAVLSNNTYPESLRYLKNFEGFGGQIPVVHRPGSNERVVSAAHMIQQYKGGDLRGYAFSILDTVKQEDTRWSIVYDIPARKIHFRFHHCRQEKVFQLQKLMEQNPVHVQGCSLRNCGCIDEENFHLVTRSENTALLKHLEKKLSRHSDFRNTGELLSEMAQWGNRHLVKKK